MPLPIAHGLLGATLVAATHPQSKSQVISLIAGALVAIAADLDFVMVFLLGPKNWHRGFSHSPAFALIVILIFALLSARARFKQALAYGLAFASHGILDYLTTLKGGGVAMLWPFSSQRFGAGWVGLSELPSRLPPIEIVRSLFLEFVIFVPLLALVLWFAKSARMKRGTLP